MIQIVTFIIFILSLIETIGLVSTFLSKNMGLTEKGHRRLGLFIVLLVISSLQLFGVFDFISYMAQ